MVSEPRYCQHGEIDWLWCDECEEEKQHRPCPSCAVRLAELERLKTEIAMDSVLRPLVAEAVSDRLRQLEEVAAAAETTIAAYDEAVRTQYLHDLVEFTIPKLRDSLTEARRRAGKEGE